MAQSNVYSFTTTPHDEYLKRVLDEATEDTDFVITTERNTLFGRGTHAVVAVRKEILVVALIAPELPLAGRTLGEWLEASFDSDGNGDWAGAIIQGDPDDIEVELERIRNEVRRIKNIKDGRVVRVNVETF